MKFRIMNNMFLVGLFIANALFSMERTESSRALTTLNIEIPDVTSDLEKDMSMPDKVKALEGGIETKIFFNSPEDLSYVKLVFTCLKGIAVKNGRAEILFKPSVFSLIEGIKKQSNKHPVLKQVATLIEKHENTTIESGKEINIPVFKDLGTAVIHDKETLPKKVILVPNAVKYIGCFVADVALTSAAFALNAWFKK